MEEPELLYPSLSTHFSGLSKSALRFNVDTNSDFFYREEQPRVESHHQTSHPPLPQVTISHDCGGGSSLAGGDGGVESAHLFGGSLSPSASACLDDHHHSWQPMSSALRIGRSQSLTPTVGHRHSPSDSSAMGGGSPGSADPFSVAGGSGPHPGGGGAWGQKMRSNSLTLGGPVSHLGRRDSYLFDSFDDAQGLGGGPSRPGESSWMRGKGIMTYLFTVQQ